MSEIMLVKVAALATALTKTSGFGSAMSKLKRMFVKQKPLTLSQMLSRPEYANYLTMQFKNPKQRALALSGIEKKLMNEYGSNLAPDALLHLTEQKQILKQLQSMPSERAWDLINRYGQYASEKPVQAVAGTLGSGYAFKKGADTVKDLLGDEDSGKSRNVIIAP